MIGKLTDALGARGALNAFGAYQAAKPYLAQIGDEPQRALLAALLTAAARFGEFKPLAGKFDAAIRAMASEAQPSPATVVTALLSDDEVSDVMLRWWESRKTPNGPPEMIECPLCHHTFFGQMVTVKSLTGMPNAK